MHLAVGGRNRTGIRMPGAASSKSSRQNTVRCRVNLNMVCQECSYQCSVCFECGIMCKAVGTHLLNSSCKGGADLVPMRPLSPPAGETRELATDSAFIAACRGGRKIDRWKERKLDSEPERNSVDASSGHPG